MLLTDEQHRILKKRIVAAIEEARYYPAKSTEHEQIAEQVLRFPFTPQVHNVGKEKHGEGQEAEASHS